MLSTNVNANLRSRVLMPIASNTISNFADNLTYMMLDEVSKAPIPAPSAGDDDKATIIDFLQQFFGDNRHIRLEEEQYELMLLEEEIKARGQEMPKASDVCQTLAPEQEGQIVTFENVARQLCDDFGVKEYNKALLPVSVVGEFSRYAYQHLGLAIQKAPGGNYVIQYGLEPVGKAIGLVTDTARGAVSYPVRMLVGQEQFDSMLSSFRDSPRGYQFLVNDMLDASILLGAGKLGKVALGTGKINARFGAIQKINVRDINVTYNSTFIGRKGWELDQNFVGSNKTQVINNIKYSAHALDQMQNRGIMPSVVEHALRFKSVPTKGINKVAYYDPINNITVIRNPVTKQIISTYYGKPSL